MKEAIAARLTDVITLCERLKASVEAERPEALLNTFALMRLGVETDGMATALQCHVERLGNPTNTTTNRGRER